MEVLARLGVLVTFFILLVPRDTRAQLLFSSKTQGFYYYNSRFVEEHEEKLEGLQWGNLSAASDLPLVDNCRTSELNLLLVAEGGGYVPYDVQMTFFSNFLEIFTSGQVDDFTRVDVSLAMACDVDDRMDLRVRFPFGTFSNISSLQSALRKDNPERGGCQRSPFIQDIQAKVLDHANKTSTPGRNTLVILLLFLRFMNQQDDSPTTRFNSMPNIKMLTISQRPSLQQLTRSAKKNPLKIHGFLTTSTPLLLPFDQAIPMIVCHKCYDGWMWKPAQKHGTSTTALSCYKTLPGSYTWDSAEKTCREHKASLVNIESTEEEKFLENYLLSYFCSEEGMGRRCMKSKSFFIGLKRNKSSLRREFQWSNELPLVYSLWKAREPFGRDTRSCAVWEFSLDPTGSGRRSLGCGDHLDGFAVCEAKAVVLPSGVLNVTCAVKKEKKEAAIERAEVAFNVLGSDSFLKGALYSTNYWRLYDETEENDIFFSIHLGQEDNTTVSVRDLKTFRCSFKDLSIPFSFVCDGEKHCWDGSDENICLTNYLSNDYCAQEEQMLDGTLCVSSTYCRWNKHSDGGACSTCDTFFCPSGECLPKHWFLDDQRDCAGCQETNSSEHAIARSNNVTDCVFSCNRTDCVTRDMLGDGVIQCSGSDGPLDESLGALQNTTCFPVSSLGESDLTTNWGPRCVYYKDPFGGILGCLNYKHLENCEDFVCPEGYVKCPDSYCIPAHYVNDGENHCPFGEDEGSMNLDCTDLFKCSGTPMCLHPDRVCDNKKDCHFGDDELNCGLTCQPGFLCVAGTVVKSGYDTSVPLTDLSFVDHRTRYLDLSGINISAVFPDLACGPAHYLVHVNLSGSKIPGSQTRLCSRPNFSGAYNIDLSYNNLQNSHLQRLLSVIHYTRFLNVSHNADITCVQILKLYNLKVLDLSYTGVHSLRLGLYLTLTHLNLRGTKVTQLRPGMFYPGTKIDTLDLRAIPLKICSLQSFEGVQISNLYADTNKLCCPQLHKDLKFCSAPVDPFSSCSDLMGGHELRVLVWILGFCAVIDNLAASINRLCYDRSSLRMAYGHFVAHLSVSDFLMGVYLLIIASADSYFRDVYFMYQDHWRHSPVCKFAGFLSALSSEVSMFFILLITLDRFLVIKFPFGQYRISGRYVHTLSAVAWVLGVCIAALPFLPPFQHWQTYTFNGVCLGLPLADNSVPGFEFAVAVFVFLNLALFLLIAFGQVVIYRALSEARKSIAQNTSRFATHRAQDIEVSKRLFLVAATDFVCWFPVCIMGLISLTGHPLGYKAYAWSAILIVPINSAINPLLYNAANIVAKIRSAWRKRRTRTAADVQLSTSHTQDRSDQSRK